MKTLEISTVARNVTLKAKIKYINQKVNWVSVQYSQVKNER